MSHDTHHHSQQDRQLYISMVAVLAVLVLIATGAFLVAKLVTVISDAGGGPSAERTAPLLVARIAPVGAVVTGDAAPAPAAEATASAIPAVFTTDMVDRSRGEQVYGQVCLACHSTGAAGSPKIDDQGAWSQRVEKGFSTLVTNAITGINAMPARGGIADLSDSDIASSVAYMLDQSGVEYSIPAADEEQTSSEQPAPEAAESSQQVAEAEQAGEQQAGEQQASEQQASEQQASEQQASEQQDSKPLEGDSDAVQRLVAAADQEASSAEAQGGDQQAQGSEEASAQGNAQAQAQRAAVQAAAQANQEETQQQEVQTDDSAVDELVHSANREAPAVEDNPFIMAPVEESSPAAEEQPSDESANAGQQSAAEASDKNASAQEAQQPTQVAAVAQASGGEYDLARGEQVYNQSCLACHMTGVINAPKLGDQAAWSKRYEEKGMATLVDHAINGFNAMPPKGGNMRLSDQDIHDSVAFMLQKSNVEF